MHRHRTRHGRRRLRDRSISSVACCCIVATLALNSCEAAGVDPGATAPAPTGVDQSEQPGPASVDAAEAQELLQLYTRGHVAAVLTIPDGESTLLNAAVRTLSARIQVLAPRGTATIEGDAIHLSLPGFTSAAIVDALLEEPTVHAALVEGLHTADLPDQTFAGCDVDEGWVCGPDESYRVGLVTGLGKPVAVEANGSVVTFTLGPAAVAAWTEVTSEAACRRDMGLGDIVLFSGSTALQAPMATAPSVACGEGLQGQEVAVSLASDEAATELAGALRASYDTTPQPTQVQVTGPAAPWPRSGQLDSPQYLIDVTADLTDGTDLSSPGLLSFKVLDGSWPDAASSPAVEYRLLVPARLYEAVGLTTCIEGPTAGDGRRRCELAAASMPGIQGLGQGHDVAIDMDLTIVDEAAADIAWPTSLLILDVTVADGPRLELEGAEG